MFHKEDDTLDLLGQYTKSKDPIKTKPLENNKERIIYRDAGKFTINKKTTQNFSFMGISLTAIFIIILFIAMKTVSYNSNPLIGKWAEINRNTPIKYMIEFTEDKIIKLGMSYKVNYEVYKDKVEVKMKAGFVESPIGEIYYIKDKNTIIEQTILGQRILKRIE